MEKQINGKTLRLVQGDITQQEVDAIRTGEDEPVEVSEIPQDLVDLRPVIWLVYSYSRGQDHVGTM